MSDTVKVKWFINKNRSNLNEIYQSTGIVFSFVSSPKNGLHQCHQWVKCRDFLQDAVRGQITGNKFSIYGFNFDVNENPAVDLNKMRMLVAKNNLKLDEISTFKKKIACSVKLLNHFEKMAKVGKTTVMEVDTRGQSKYSFIFLFTGSNMWIKSPFLVSMYTFLIRLGDLEIKFKNNSDLKKKFLVLIKEWENKTKSNNDVVYLSNSWNKLDLIIKNRSKIFQMKNKVHDVYMKNYNIDSFHSRSGIDSLARCRTVDSIVNSTMKKFIEDNKIDSNT